MNADYATTADYLRIGIELGLLEPREAHDWADAVVRAEDAPSPEILEVGASADVPALLRHLCTVPGEGDRALAGRWLLADLAEVLATCGDDDLEQVVRQALAVCVAAGLDEATWRRFDTIDDELSLAHTGAHGSVAACRASLAGALAGCGVAPDADAGSSGTPA
jgi:hypothetical protein